MRAMLVGAIAACSLLGPLAASASAEIRLTYTQGSTDTMQVSVTSSNEDFQVTNPPADDAYVFDTSCFGCSNNAITVVDVPAGICAPAVSQTVTCQTAEGAEAPYRLTFSNDSTHTMDLGLFGGAGNASGRWPAPVTINANAAIDVVATSNSDPTIDVAFNGGPAADSYQMGSGEERIHGNGGVDTISYAGYDVGAEEATVTLDDLANDTVDGDVNVDNVFSDVENLTGGNGPDSLTGDADANELRGGPGFDDLDGGDGANILRAEDGGATMTARSGSDLFDGDPEDGGTVSYADRAAGVQASVDGAANDGVFPEGDNLDNEISRIVGGSGSDTLIGVGALGVVLIGGASADFLSGSTLGDTLDGGGGGDLIEGLGGNDTIRPGTETDTYDGGAGTNDLDYSDSTANMNLSINDGVNDGEGGLEEVNSTFDNIRSGSGRDTLAGDNGANVFNAGEGADSVDAKGGVDLLAADLGVADGSCDRMMGGAGSDTYNVPADPCNTTLDFSDHAVGVTVNLASTASAQVIAPGETESFQGSNVDVIGTAQADAIAVTTATGPHTLTGGLGNDTLTGGAGGNDTSSYADRSAPVTADLDGVNDDGQAGEADILTGIENLIGGTGADDLTGSGGANLLRGLGGGDSLTGLGAADRLELGAGDDSANAQDGIADTIDCTGGGADGGSVDASEIFLACDSDGDGAQIFFDNCPTVSGSDGGCPAPAVATPPATGENPECSVLRKKLKKAKSKKKKRKIRRQLRRLGC